MTQDSGTTTEPPVDYDVLGRNGQAQADPETRRMAKELSERLAALCFEMISGQKFGKTVLEIDWGRGQINTYDTGNIPRERAQRRSRS